MEEMKKNEALSIFEDEYNRLYETLYETHRNEKALSSQCTKLKVNRELSDRDASPFRLPRFLVQRDESASRLFLTAAYRD